MKIRIPIQDVQEGDIIHGKPVTNVLHRNHAKYVRCTLQGGWPIVDGYEGEMVEVERPV